MDIRLLASHPARVYAVVLDVGDEVANCLDRFAMETRVDAASFTAIGGVSEATLGFFDLAISDYREIRVTEQAEVVSLVGDITRGDDTQVDPSARTVHGHMVVARADGSTVGGHLLEASVRPTLEVIVTEQPAHLRRRYDSRTGLALVDLRGGESLVSPVFIGQSDGADRS
jgi:predicted DNA-binding protein with PD1-like motif